MRAKRKKLLTTKDKALIELLRADGRKSLTELGETLRVSHVAVSKRLDKLIKSGLLKIQALINPAKLNLRFATILVEVDSERNLERVLKMYEECPRVALVMPQTAGYNVLAVIVAETSEVLERVITACALRTYEGIRRTEVFIARPPKYPRYMPLKMPATRKGSGPAPCGLYCPECNAYVEDECPGCPSMKYYKGPL